MPYTVFRQDPYGIHAGEACVRGIDDLQKAKEIAVASHAEYAEVVDADTQKVVWAVHPGRHPPRA